MRFLIVPAFIGLYAAGKAYVNFRSKPADYDAIFTYAMGEFFGSAMAALIFWSMG